MYRGNCGSPARFTLFRHTPFDAVPLVSICLLSAFIRRIRGDSR